MPYNFEIYNHSSEKIPEILNDAVDLIITDPPWNMGATFGSVKNFSSVEEYENLISSVAKECFRVLNKDGFTVVICSNIVKHSGRISELRNLFVGIFISAGFYMNDQIPVIFGEEVDTDWSVVSSLNIYNKEIDWAYSKESSILVFSKMVKNSRDSSRLINKHYKFKSMDGHPCPTSLEMIDDLLKLFLSRKMKVLDPFMGTATLGVETIKRGGYFYGYETVKEYYDTARSKLESEGSALGN